MARREDKTGPNGAYTRYYIDAAVGWNCPNHTDDVALVQTMLLLWSKSNSMKYSDFWLQLNPLAIDGDFGPNTLFWLCNYDGNTCGGLASEACKMKTTTSKFGVLTAFAEQNHKSFYGKGWNQLHTMPGLPAYLVNKLKA